MPTSEERDKTIASRYAEGASPDTIATDLGISRRTVYNVIQRTVGVKRKMHSLTEAEEVEVERRYRAGEPALVISRDYPVNVQTIHNVLRRRGIDGNPELSRPRFSEEQRATAVEIAKTRGIPAAIAEVGISEKTVGILLRKRREAGEVIDLPQGRPRVYEVNDAAFDVLTPEACYWIGFLWADGCVHHNSGGSAPSLICGLGEKDRGHLEKLKKFLGSTYPISTSNGQHGFGRGRTVYHSVRSERLCAALESLGFAKKRTRSPAPALVASRDFWRGAIDGDGWLSCSGGCPNFGLSGQANLLEAFNSFAGKKLGVRPLAGAAYRLGTSGAVAAGALIRTLYLDACVGLDRKVARANDIIAGRFDNSTPYTEAGCTVPADALLEEDHDLPRQEEH